MTTESKKQLQFRDIMAKLEELSAKLDELLQRTAPKENQIGTAVQFDPPAAGNPRAHVPRVDPNLGSL